MNAPTSRDGADFSKLVAYLDDWTAKHGGAIESLRRAMDAAQDRIELPEGMAAQPWRHASLGGQMLIGAETRADRILLYLHGGGYHYGSSRSHRHLAGALAAAARCDALVLDYRLAPEHPFPAAFDDALDAYRHLSASRPAGRVAIAGDSAGGGLAIAVAKAARDQGLPAPAAIACMSPWLDLTCRDLTSAEVARIDDPIVSLPQMRSYASAYLAGADARNPSASPLLGRLDGLAPIYLQTGSREVAVRDTLAFALACPGALVVELQPDAPHVWQWFWPRLRAACSAIERLGRFLLEQFESQSAFVSAV